MEENKDKIRFWGALDVSARTLEDIPEEFLRLYDGGNYRMKPEEIRRMGLYLARVQRAAKSISEVLRFFKQIETATEKKK